MGEDHSRSQAVQQHIDRPFCCHSCYYSFKIGMAIVALLCRDTGFSMGISVHQDQSNLAKITNDAWIGTLASEERALQCFRGGVCLAKFTSQSPPHVGFGGSLQVDPYPQTPDHTPSSGHSILFCASLNCLMRAFVLQCSIGELSELSAVPGNFAGCRLSRRTPKRSHPYTLKGSRPTPVGRPSMLPTDEIL